MSEICESDRKASYFEYLTQELDAGIKNVVVDTARQAVHKRLKEESGSVKIADVGCFTGSVINQIYTGLPEELRNRISLFGLDNDEEILVNAFKARPHINFVRCDIIDPPSFNKVFHVVILSNVLHEVYSSKLPNKRQAKNAVKSSLFHIQEMLAPGGEIILLDGLMPENANQRVVLELTEPEFARFFSFSQSNYIEPIRFRELRDFRIETDLRSLAAFLTKARYLEKGYWQQEAQQAYQYFTFEEFSNALLEADFIIEEVLLQSVNQNNAMLPPKNVLIRARKRLLRQNR